MKIPKLSLFTDSKLEPYSWDLDPSSFIHTIIWRGLGISQNSASCPHFCPDLNIGKKIRAMSYSYKTEINLVHHPSPPPNPYARYMFRYISRPLAGSR